MDEPVHRVRRRRGLGEAGEDQLELARIARDVADGEDAGRAGGAGIGRGAGGGVGRAVDCGGRRGDRLSVAVGQRSPVQARRDPNGVAVTRAERERTIQNREGHILTREIGLL